MSKHEKQFAVSNLNGILKLIIVLSSLFFVFFAVSCKDKKNVTGPGDPNPPKPPAAPVARISASTTSGTAPLNVNFSDESTGEITTRKWEFHNGQTSSSRQVSFNYATAGAHLARLTVEGPGGSNSATLTIRVVNPTPKVSLSDLKYVSNNSSRMVSLSVDVNFKEYANQRRVLGIYWLKTCGANFCFQNASCNTNAPGRSLGFLQVLGPISNDANFNDVGVNFPYSCFPDRSRGTTYYGYAVVYDRIDLNAVTDVNNPALSSIGPPSKIVSITWQ